MELEWDDVVWEDPDGGTIVLHGVLPTTVHPRQLRPRIEWHAIALLEGPEIEDVWELEEASEIESQGINLTSAVLGGGLDSVLIQDLIQLDDLQTGWFPDPEPRRLHRLALRHIPPSSGKNASSSHISRHILGWLLSIKDSTLHRFSPLLSKADH